MIPPGSVLRVARPTDNLQAIGQMYAKGLGFEILSQFKDHDGFDGVILCHKKHPYHLEFTNHQGPSVGKAPTQDNLIVFYIADSNRWEAACNCMQAAGFNHVPSYNPYWDVVGKTYEDLDGYRVVLNNREWSV